MSKSNNKKADKSKALESANNAVLSTNNETPVASESESESAMPLAVAESSAQVSKDAHKDLTIETLDRLARELLLQYGTISKIVADNVFKPLVDKYGKKNAKDITRQCKAIRASKFDAKFNALVDEFNNYTSALNSEYNRLKQCNGFEEYTTFVANTWGNATEFISACYPYVIDGKPAKKVAYIKNSETYIIDVFELCEPKGTNATAYLLACLKNIRKANLKAYKGGKDSDTPTISNAVSLGQIADVFNADKANAPLFFEKGDKVTDKATKTAIISAGIADYVKLSEYRKDKKGA